MRYRQRQRKEYYAGQKPEFYTYGNYFLYSCDILFTPILRRKHYDSHAYAGCHLLKHELYLIYQRRARQRQLRIRSEHYVVYHIYHKRRKLLQSYDYQQRKKCPVKTLFLYKYS